MTCETNPDLIARELIRNLFDAPGHFRISLIKNGDIVEIIAGQPTDFLNLKQVADYFGVTPQTIRRRYIETNQLKKTHLGYRLSDVEALRHAQ